MGVLEKSLNDLSEANVPADIGNTAENTQAIKDSLDISSEDLKYLRDLAEQEVINRFTTAELKLILQPITMLTQIQILMEL